MSEKLKPRPFCGGEAKFGANKSCCGRTVRIDCTNPECRGCVTTFSSKAEATKAWNRRVQQPNEPLTLDELRQMIGQWVWVESKDVLCPNGWHRVEPQFREAVSLEGVDGTIYETSIANGDSVSYRCPPEAGEKE
jgi:hypothetical protein